MGYWGEYYPKYVSVAEKKAKAEKKLNQLKKKNPDIEPVILKGSKLASTWWGRAWNTNLERYADYSNRIGRGRSYVRHGAVLDLQILSGEIKALVQGSRANPYSVTIEINGMDKNIWKEIKAVCQGKLESLSELLMGKFPKELQEIFMAKGRGLFPSPKEISFRCTCPDWAFMCKHVAAVLYGVGARLDENPSLFFKLRKIEMNDLITQAVKEKSENLLKKAEKKSSRVMNVADISGVFGIEMDVPDEISSDSEPEAVSVKTTGSEIKTPSTKKTSDKKRNSKNKAVRKKPVKNADKEKTALEKSSIIDIVLGILRKTRKGATVADIATHTALDEKQIQNALYRAKKQGKIKTDKKGVYKSA